MIIPYTQFTEDLAHREAGLRNMKNHPTQNNTIPLYPRKVRGLIAERTFIKYIKSFYTISVGLPSNDYHESDKFDVKLEGITVDIKSTNRQEFNLQVTPEGVSDDRPIDYYLHAYVNQNEMTVHFKGFAKRNKVLKNEFIIKKGEIIPNSTLSQGHEYSYFYTDELIDTKKFLQNIQAKAIEINEAVYSETIDDQIKVHHATGKARGNDLLKSSNSTKPIKEIIETNKSDFMNLNNIFTDQRAMELVQECRSITPYSITTDDKGNFCVPSVHLETVQQFFNQKNIQVIDTGRKAGFAKIVLFQKIKQAI